VAICLTFVVFGFMVIVNELSWRNHDLKGLRSVALSTSPSGARVVFAPLDKATGEPLADEVIRVKHRSPISCELAPGDYLVVVALADGRFHEVYREVPRLTDEMIVNGERRKIRTQANGVVNLGEIKIPPADPWEGMALIDAYETKGRPTTPAFYMDVAECTMGSYERTMGSLPRDKRWKPVPADSPACVDFQQAMAVAERQGKRLPTEREFEAAVRYCGAVQGPPGSDTTLTDPPIRQLLSGVAEWTITPASEFDLVGGSGAFRLRSQVVRAASLDVLEAGPKGDDLPRDPKLRAEVQRYSYKPGLGFRCVRSAKPSF
jgi:hypothetical protein